jgi:transposase
MALVLRQAQQIARLEGKVAALEERLGKSSRNSSKPPSSDGPGTPERRSREPSGRKPGGQPGHERATRPLIPTEEADEVIPLKPERCEACGKRLDGEDPEPRRHQVTEIPKVVPRVTEYQQHTLGCACGHQTTAALPAEAASCFGPRLESVAALLTGAYHASKRSAQEILQDLFGVAMSLGALSGCEDKVGTLLAGPVAEAFAWAREQSAAHADETGWKEGRRRAWLWVLTTASVTVFKVHARRTKEAAKELLGWFAGVLHTDRWGAYNIYKGLRQICWAHLLRDFRGFSEHRGPSAGRIGKELLKRARRLLKLWAKVRDGTWDRKRYRRATARLRGEIEAFLREGADCRHATMRRECRMILKHVKNLWTFTRIDGVEPTNNAAERSVRPAVLWRRKSFGTQSARGSRFVERMLTVSATLRQQNRNVTDYLTEVCASALSGRPAPSLLPASNGLE